MFYLAQPAGSSIVNIIERLSCSIQSFSSQFMFGPRPSPKLVMFPYWPHYNHFGQPNPSSTRPPPHLFYHPTTFTHPYDVSNSGNSSSSRFGAHSGWCQILLSPELFAFKIHPRVLALLQVSIYLSTLDLNPRPDRA